MGEQVYSNLLYILYKEYEDLFVYIKYIMYLCGMTKPTAIYNDKVIPKLYKKYFGKKVIEVEKDYHKFKVVVKSVSVKTFENSPFYNRNIKKNYEVVVINLEVIDGKVQSRYTGGYYRSLSSQRNCRVSYNRMLRYMFGRRDNPLKTYFDIFYNGMERAFEVGKITYA